MIRIPNIIPAVKCRGNFTPVLTGYSLDGLHLLHLYPRFTIDTTGFRLDETGRFYEYESALFIITIRNLWRGQQVLVQFRSFPRLIHPSNLFCVSTAEDIARCLRAAAEELRKILGVPFPVRKATVTRVEINRDYFLGDRLDSFFEALTRFNAPRMERTLEPNLGLFPTTVRYHNKSRQIQFYQKWLQLECKYGGRLPEFMRAFAKGLLRGEIELHGRVLQRFASDFQRVRKADRRAAKLLTPAFLAHAFERMVREARLDGEFPKWETFRRNNRRRLKSAHPRMLDDTLTKIFDVLKDVASFGESQARSMHSPRSVRYAKSKLSPLNMWRLNFAREDLPALSWFPNDNPTPEGP
jgi:hypothetical protein